MYVLDTNAFYYAAEISQFTYDKEKLEKFINNNDTFISSTSLFEFLVKHKSNIETIRKGGRYLLDHHIKLAFNVFNPIPKHYYDDFINLSEKQYELMYEDILENKINIESRFTSLLFDMCLFSGYYFVAMSTGKEPCTYCFAAIETVYRMFSSCVLDVFKQIYEDGYKTDDCENFVRNSFYNLLAFMLEKGIPYIEKAKTVTSDEQYLSPDEWFTAEDYSRLTSAIYSKMQTRTSTAFLQRLAVTYWKNNNDPELKKHIAKMKAIFDKRIRYEALQDYLYDTLVDILVHGAALWKNDFLDALIMCNIENQHQLITFDNGVIRRMEKRRGQYKQYDESLKTIAWLKA